MKYIVSLFALLLILPGLSAQEVVTGNLKIIGKAKMLLLPDIVTISFRFNVKDKSSSSAQSLLIQETNKLIVRLQKLGYDKSVIKLLNFHIQDDWDEGRENRKKIGFLASDEIELSINYDPLKVSQLIDSIGFSSFKYLEYSLDLEISENLKNSARDNLVRNAIENARHSADVISKSSNILLDGINNIEYSDLVFNVASNVNTPPPPPPPPAEMNTASSLKLMDEYVSLKKLQVYEEVIINWRIKNVR